MDDKRIIKVFVDDDPEPFAAFSPPAKFLFDTTRLPDGPHTLKVVARSSSGQEGIRIIPFEVRNGPSISVVGLKENDVVDSRIPLTINAYGSERSDLFVVTGSETPKAIPAWVWALLIIFIAWGVFYLVMYWDKGMI
ncbi:MAG: cytochrome C [Solitalea sp.]